MLSFVDTRDRHFRAACRRIINELPAGETLTLDELIEKAIHTEAPHYYCTYEYALRMVRVLRHGRLEVRRDRRHELWCELSARCQQLEEKKGWTLPHALSHVLATGRATQFFITPERARRILTMTAGPKGTQAADALAG
ncbi:MAG: hypothetical protein K2G35_10890 [Duncaniella sp.]|nr:hypothetical protein [Duncaniella sp.]